MPAEPQIAPIAATSASVIAIKPGVTIEGDEVGGVPSKVATVAVIFGWNLNESTGSATAKFRVRDGTSSGGREIATVALAANGVSDITLGNNGAQLNNNGIYVEVLSGSIEGSVLWG